MFQRLRQKFKHVLSRDPFKPISNKALDLHELVPVSWTFFYPLAEVTGCYIDRFLVPCLRRQLIWRPSNRQIRLATLRASWLYVIKRHQRTEHCDNIIASSQCQLLFVSLKIPSSPLHQTNLGQHSPYPRTQRVLNVSPPFPIHLVCPIPKPISPTQSSSSFCSEMNRVHDSDRYLQNGSHVVNFPFLSLTNFACPGPPYSAVQDLSSQMTTLTQPCIFRYHRMQFAFNPPPQPATSPGPGHHRVVVNLTESPWG